MTSNRRKVAAGVASRLSEREKDNIAQAVLGLLHRIEVKTHEKEG